MEVEQKETFLTKRNEPKPKLQVRINQIDYTLIPSGDLDHSRLPRVPVIRIFGPSSSGRNACVHIHQVYPYFFVQYTGKLNTKHVNRYISKLLHSLNHAVALSLKRDPDSAKSQFVRAIVLVRGIDFYGFHSSHSAFLKIFIVDPTYLRRIHTILQSGSVMGTCFRIFESHLSFILQFLSDFGLYGCGIIELEDAQERAPAVSDEGIQNLKSTAIFEASSYFRESRLPLEFDAIAPHILNRHRLSARVVPYQPSSPAEPSLQDPVVIGVRELWEDERTHRRDAGLDPSPEIPVDPSTSSRSAGGVWVQEARWWDDIAQRLESDRPDPAANRGRDDETWQQYVMTTFESIEVLWGEQYRTWKPTNKSVTGATDDDADLDIVYEYPWDGDCEEADAAVDVDISLISEGEFSQLQHEEARGYDVAAQHEDKSDADQNAIEEETGPDPNIMTEIGEAPLEDSTENPFLEAEPSSPDKLTAEYHLPSPPSPGPLLFSRDSTPTQIRKGDKERYKPSEQFVEEQESNPTDLQILEPMIEQAPQNVNVAEIVSTFQVIPTVSAKRRSELITARAVKISEVLDTCQKVNRNRYLYSLLPPSKSSLMLQLQTLGLPGQFYQSPYYSRNEDVPDTFREYGGLQFKLKGGEGIVDLDDWSGPQEENQILRSTAPLDALGVGGWEYASHPPAKRLIQSTMYMMHSSYCALRSQIRGPTANNMYGFKVSSAGPENSSRDKVDLTVFSLEIFVATKGEKVPDPEGDEVIAAFYAHHAAGEQVPKLGVLAQDKPCFSPARLRGYNITVFTNELDLLNAIVDLTLAIDPDILTGWDVQLTSWNFLEARGLTYGISLSELLSRAPPKPSFGASDKWSLRKASTFKVAGRHVINLWRIVRSERALTIYSFELVVFEVLHKRVPKYTYRTLTEWFESPVPSHTSLLIDYFITRTRTNLDLLEELEVVTKTAEFARVFGVDFFSVLTRGSQFKVESFMFRIAKPESFVLISPSPNDVGKQNAAECMPLIMEPASAFYSNPLLVLDFQSLYPSIMIAYNYCYSTCLGRVNKFQGAYKFGVVPDLAMPAETLERHKGSINVAPNGIMYVKPDVRKGLLGRMLGELLDTRVMVKQAMKRCGGDKVRRRILDARQLGLKYIANVTYGYTSASFSGRMPAVEIADSIVQSGRETLEKAIDVINNTEKWNAQVVYGDTDSVFVYLPGRTKEDAFTIGNDIAECITTLNPAPIKLKFEKVYLPCVLLAKKRYVGFKYENITDTDPVFDAKGIETVRRDGIPAQRKMVETCLRILFRTRDLSEVKEYCWDSWSKILDDRAPVYDFIFAKEVRLGSYSIDSDKGPPPAGAMVAARRLVSDHNNEAQYGERVPYVIARSATDDLLVDRAMDPLEFMNNSDMHLDTRYYISRVLIPPLERIFNLLGVDVQQWFDEMPRAVILTEAQSPRRQERSESPEMPISVPISSQDPVIHEHFENTECIVCGEPARHGVCYECFYSPQRTLATLLSLTRLRERRFVNAHRTCVMCTGSTLADPIACVSLDCPWFYVRRATEATAEDNEACEELVELLEIEAGRDSEGRDDDMGLTDGSEEEDGQESEYGSYASGEDVSDEEHGRWMFS